jgi:hypothetical protein
MFVVMQKGHDGRYVVLSEHLSQSAAYNVAQRHAISGVETFVFMFSMRISSELQVVEQGQLL